MSEALADIVSLDRARSKRDRKQLVDPVLFYVKCRIGVCMVECAMTQTGLDVLAMFNAELERRRDYPIELGEVMVCTSHTDDLDHRRYRR